MLSLILLQAAEYAVTISEVGAVFGAAISLIGASYGISRIGVTALETIARQPEAAGDIRSTMVVSAALIEGAAFFAIVVCLLVLVV